MEQWTTTLDLREAAAFGTLGMIVRVNRNFDSRTSTEVCRFSISLTDVERKLSTPRLRNQLRSGELEAKDPGHPLLTIFRAFRNREMLMDLAKKGRKIRLVQARGTRVWEYEDAAEGLRGVKRGDFVIKTGDLKVVAALATIGLSVLKIEGSEPNLLYWVESRPGPDGIDPTDLIRMWRQDKASVPWEHPFAQAMRGFYNRERTLDAVRNCMRMVTVRAPGSTGRSAILSEAAPAAAWDKVKNFLG